SSAGLAGSIMPRRAKRWPAMTGTIAACRSALAAQSKPAEPHLETCDEARCLLDAVHGQSSVQKGATPAGTLERHALLDARWPSDPRWCCWPVVRQCGSRPAEDREGDPGPGGRAGFRTSVSDGASNGVRARRAGGEAGTGGHDKVVLHQFGVGI